MRHVKERNSGMRAIAISIEMNLIKITFRVRNILLMFIVKVSYTVKTRL